MAPPTGPRGGSRGGASSTTSRNTRTSTTSASRSAPRGGIAKRGRAAPRVDRDGDLDMGAASSARSGGGLNKTANASSRRGNSRSTGPKSNSRLQQNLDRHLGDTSQIPRAPTAPRAAVSTITLIVGGLKSSKAATNADGGVKSLVEFVEKKATHIKRKDASATGTRGSVRPVLVKKVCQGIREWVREVTQHRQKGPHLLWCNDPRISSR